MMDDLPENIKRIRRPGKKPQVKSQKPKVVAANLEPAKSGLKGDRWAQLNCFVDDHLQKFDNITLGLLWLSIFRHANSTGVAKISQERLAGTIGRSRRQVGRLIETLDSLGYLKKVRQGGLAKGVNKYQLCVPD